MRISKALPNGNNPAPDEAGLFVNTMNEIFDDYPEVLRYAKRIDAYSSTTFNHSVNVALQTHNILVKNPSYTKEEIKEWTAAAFVHDIGKLTTPLDILHSKEKYRNNNEWDENCKTPYAIMMEHSIDGYDLAISSNFTPKMVFTSVAHHIDAKALNNGPIKGFEGATDSRKTWRNSFPNNQIEKMFCNNFYWVNEKDIETVKIISTCDAVEAMRSNERMYNNRQQKTWESISNIFKEDYEIQKVDDMQMGLFSDKDDQEEFDLLQSHNCSQMIRKQVSKKGKDIPFELSEDKIQEIVDNPWFGEEFFTPVEKEVGIGYEINIGDGRILELERINNIPSFDNHVNLIDFEKERSMDFEIFEK